MNIHCSAFDGVHPWSKYATHPIAPRWSRHAALLVLAGASLRRPHALPATPSAARSGTFNCRF